MENIKAIIVDDELSSLQNLQQKLAVFCPAVKVIASIQKPEEAIERIRELKPNLLFLDIEMPKMSGFRMLEELGEYDFEIIFTTAYNDFSVDAIRISAFDYLVKPIAITELQAAVERLEHKHSRYTREKIDVLKASLNDKKSQEDKIAIPSLEGLDFLSIKTIIHIESSSNYCKIYLQNNKIILVTRLLKDFEDMLIPYRFYRVHHSHLINLNHIQKYLRGDGGQVLMQDGTMIDVARRKKEEFLRIIS